MYPHAKGGTDRGMWITLFTPSYSYQQWDVDKFIRYCQSVMLDGKDDGVAVKDPNFNVLPNLSS